MTKLLSRLRRHLSYANVMASIAVFVALGGVGYAATKINGNDIAKRTIGAGKLKNRTLGSNQVKKNALTGVVIDESTLELVPAAQTAVTATSAGSANTANIANTATSATTAGSANTAKSADTATHAGSADTATTATTADSAATADVADTLEGVTAAQLQVTCPANTDLYGGMCWDQTARPATNWISASVDCGEDGGRLPSLSELIAYVLQPGVAASVPVWSGDVTELDTGTGEESILTRTKTTTSFSRAPTNLGYHCLFYRVN